jgi:glycosyltransferase involved in cell wall biosynthesis
VRILYVIDSLKIGDSEMLLLSLLHAYHEQHELRVAYFKHGALYDDVRSLGIPVHRLSRSRLDYASALPRLLRLMRAWRPDVVHTHQFKSDLVGQLAATLAGVPARVSTLHGGNPRSSRMMRQAVSRAHAVIAVNEKVRDFAIQRGSCDPDRVVIIPNGVDLFRFDPACVHPLDKVVLWALPENALTIGSIGRLEPASGLPILLQAAAIVTRQLPQARFVILGEGPLRPVLEAQRNRLALQEYVIFAGDACDMPRTLAALDVVAFASLWEALPTGLLEALAMARPVVATRVGSIPEVITDGHNGLLVPPNHPQQLADRLLCLLRDAELRTRLGQQARQTLQQTGSDKIMHRRTLDLYYLLARQSLTPHKASIYTV